MSAFGGKVDMPFCTANGLEQSRHLKVPQAPPNHCQHIGGASPLLTVGQSQRKMQQNQNYN
jgi:hypothetical protein